MEKPARINAITTAVPPHVLTQSQAADLAAELLSSIPHVFNRLLPSFKNAQVDKRHFCVPVETWLKEDRSFKERNEMCVMHSVDLLEQATRSCLEQAGMEAEELGGIIVATTSALAVPSIDALLMDRMGLRPDMRRLPLFGLGCASGPIGLAHAAMMAQAEPGLRVLVAAVDVSSLMFHRGNMGKGTVISFTLFGDGASAAIVSCEGEGAVVKGLKEYTWPDSLSLAKVEYSELGASVLLSKDIVQHFVGDTDKMIDWYLNSQNLSPEDVDGYIIHPGGVKILDAFEDALKLPSGGLIHARETLRQYGHVGAATVMFVLERTLANEKGRFLMFGPGFGLTGAFLTVEN